MIEPNLGLTAQSRLWRTGFLILAVLVLACGLVARRLSRSRPAGNIRRMPVAAVRDLNRGSRSHHEPAVAIWLRWLVLVFIPSSWLLGVTAYLTTDMASIPLFWTIPLALYLLSFHSRLRAVGTTARPRRHLVASLHRAADLGAGHERRVRSPDTGFRFI